MVHGGLTVDAPSLQHPCHPRAVTATVSSLAPWGNVLAGWMRRCRDEVLDTRAGVWDTHSKSMGTRTTELFGSRPWEHVVHAVKLRAWSQNAGTGIKGLHR